MPVPINVSVVAVALVILGVGVGSLFSPPLRLTTVFVRGGSGTVRAEAETVARKYIAERTRLAGVPRLFLAQPTILAREVEEQIPSIDTVQVFRRLPGILELHVQEKVPVAYLDVAGQVSALDNEGRIIADATAEEARQSGLPLIRDARTSIPVRPGDTVLTPAIVTLLHDMVVQLPEQFSVSAVELTIPSVGAEEIRVRTDAGWLLALDTTRPLAEQLRTLEKVVTEELTPEDYKRLKEVDLRIPGKVYYRIGNR